MPKTRSRTMVIAHGIGLGVGAILLCVGLWRLLLLPVECSGREMALDQVCTGVEKGQRVSRTFDQQRALRDSTTGFLIVGGFVVAAGSGGLLVREIRRIPARVDNRNFT